LAPTNGPWSHSACSLSVSAIAALIAETVWALLVAALAGLVLMWALALLHDAGYVAPAHGAGHA
jgi:hypothetical protein